MAGRLKMKTPPRGQRPAQPWSMGPFSWSTFEVHPRSGSKGLRPVWTTWAPTVTTSTSSDPQHAPLDPAVEELRLASLLRQAPLEFARVVYGLNDRANGRAGTMAAEEVARTVRHGFP